MRYWFLMLIAGAVGAVLFTTQPITFAKEKDKKDKEPPKGPMYPPVNPAIAKLDINAVLTEGPGFAISYDSKADVLAASFEKGTIAVLKKDALASFKAGPGKAEILKGHDGPVVGLAMADSSFLASAGADKKINFWKMPEGKIAQTGTVDFRVRAIAMSSDGKTLAVVGESETIQLFDVTAGKATIKLTDKMDWNLCVAFSSDGKQLLTGDYHGVVRLWDVPGGKKVKDLPAPPMPAPKTPPDPVPVTAVSFAPDGKTIVVGTAEGKIDFINLADGKVARTLGAPPAGHTSAITGIVFHPTGTLMATCSKDRTVKLWNPAAPAPLKSLDGHNAWIEGMVFIDQASKLATVSADGTIKTWDLAEPPKKK